MKKVLHCGTFLFYYAMIVIYMFIVNTSIAA
jgi:hypothetical protein